MAILIEGKKTEQRKMSRWTKLKNLIKLMWDFRKYGLLDSVVLASQVNREIESVVLHGDWGE